METTNNNTTGQPNHNASQPPYVTPAERHRRTSVTAMIFSIVGVAIFFLPIINIAGFILSIIGFVKAKNNRLLAERNRIPENNMNTAAYIIGIIGIIAGAIGVLIVILSIVLFGALIGVALTNTTVIADSVTRALPELGTSVGAVLDAVNNLLGTISSIL